MNVSYTLGESRMEKDLRVLVDNKLSNCNCMQYQAAASKASIFLVCINKGIYSVDKTIILLLYKSQVWTQLGYATQSWSSVLRKMVLELEKIIRELKGLSYEEWLNTLNLVSLKKRNLRGHMITKYKYLSGGSRIGGKQISLRSFRKTSVQSMTLDEKWFKQKLCYIYFYCWSIKDMELPLAICGVSGKCS